MILGIWRILRCLAWYHHAMIFITVLLPFLWGSGSTRWISDHSILTSIYQWAALLGFWLLACVFVAVVVRKDRSIAERFVSQEVEAVWDEVQAIKVRYDDLLAHHTDSIDDLRRLVGDQDEIFRSAFERLGQSLPGRTISVGAEPVLWHVTTSSPTVTVTGGKWWRRLLRFGRRSGLWMWAKVWGTSNHD